MLPSSLHQRTEDPLNSLVSAPQWINGPMGDSGSKAPAHKPSRKFSTKWNPKGGHSYILMTYDPVPWCLSHSVFMNQSSMNDESSSIISPWLPYRNCGSLVLVERWRTEAFSQFCLQIALPYKEGNRKLIVPWSSFNTHRTTDNACACLLSH